MQLIYHYNLPMHWFRLAHAFTYTVSSKICSHTIATFVAELLYRLIFIWSLRTVKLS